MSRQFNLNIKNKVSEKPCDYCGGSDFKILSKKDRYALPTTTVICKKCGLVFLNPVMNAESYADFYEHSYRKLLQAYKNKDVAWDLDKNFEASARLGSFLANELGNYIKPRLMIEVGSSTGGILAGFKESIQGLEIMGIEPSSEEANFAIRKNIDTHIGLIENIKIDLPKADNILIVRSLNHLVSPNYFFYWAHHQLKTDGRLIVMVINFWDLCKSRGLIYSQIDHPFMFYPESLVSCIESAGFDIIFKDLESNPRYIKLVAVKKDIVTSADKKINLDLYRSCLKILSPTKLKLSFWGNKILRHFI